MIMNTVAPVLEAIKFLKTQGVDVQPYLERVQMVIGQRLPLNDLFNHDYADKGLKFRIDFLPSYGHKVPIKGRDPREPRLLQKLKLERWIQDIFVRRFKEQIKELRNEYKLAKPKKIPKPVNEKDFIDELISALLSGVSEGVELFTSTVMIGYDYTLANQHAAEWARSYAFDLIKEIDDTSLKVVQSAIESFVNQSGYNIGDVIEMIEPYFGDIRSSMIAVTETTRAFAQGQLAAAQELHKEFPDLEIYKTWFTNNDDRVCDDCGPLDGQSVPMNESFPGEFEDPPAHPNCRCWIEYNTNVGGNGGQ